MPSACWALFQHLQCGWLKNFHSRESQGSQIFVVRATEDIGNGLVVDSVGSREQIPGVWEQGGWKMGSVQHGEDRWFGVVTEVNWDGRHHGIRPGSLMKRWVQGPECGATRQPVSPVAPSGVGPGLFRGVLYTAAWNGRERRASWLRLGTWWSQLAPRESGGLFSLAASCSLGVFVD